jgi:hypothetical protein
MSRQRANSFWRGYSGVLSIYPAARRPRRFLYRGLDMENINSIDAFTMDWGMIGRYFSAALKEAESERRREPSRTY